MSQVDLFLEGLKSQQLDESTCLIYADFLEENGEPLKAEYLRLESSLTRIEGTDPRYGKEEARLREIRSALSEEWISLVGRKYSLYVTKIQVAPQGWMGQVLTFLTRNWESTDHEDPYRMLGRLSRDAAERLRDLVKPFAEVYICAEPSTDLLPSRQSSDGTPPQ